MRPVAMHNAPVKLVPKYLSYIWGGTLLRDSLGKNIPSDDTGESWEVSAHSKGQSLIATGPDAGMPLEQYAQGGSFYGAAQYNEFPLLIKLLGASANLSAQVHPGDDNCRPGESGKAEAWVVLTCPEGAELIYGIEGTVEEFTAAVRTGAIESKLHRLAVKPGDVLDIPAGMVHALTAGIVAYEVQQNSDTTYRLYDWGRVDAATGAPRELHIDEALRVVRAYPGFGPVSGTVTVENNCIRTRYINNPHFKLEKLEISSPFVDHGHHGFAAYTAIDGSGSVWKDGAKCFDVALGDTFVSPAAAGAVELDGRMAMLKSYV